MFSSSRIRHPGDSFSKHRAGKSSSSHIKIKRSFKGDSHRLPAHLDLTSSKTFEQANQHPPAAAAANITQNSAVTTIAVGPAESPRLFAAHEDVLRASPYFASMLKSTEYLTTTDKKINLIDDTPEVFAAVLEYLYKGDYFPKLEYDSRRRVWYLENDAVSPGNPESTVWVPTAPPSPSLNQDLFYAASTGAHILKDTAIYCVADRYGLSQLKRLALRKQGLQAGIPVSTILASARFAYANTPDTDSKLRAHYLALIIRSRNTFKRSGTMQAEMSMAGSAPTSPIIGYPQNANNAAAAGSTGLWFDLFVAMCNHLDDMEKLVGRSR